MTKNVQITATYSIENYIKDSVDIKQEIINEMARTLSQKIDWELISDMLANIDGWIGVDLVYKDAQPSVTEIQNWVIENIGGSFKSHGYSWLFKEEKDAALFALRWL